MIYFMQPVDGGPVKIGYSCDVDRRHKVLESYYGCRLSVLAIIKGGREKEAAIHRQFDHLRLGTSEQFRPASDLMEFIGRPLLVSANPDAVELVPPSGNWRIHVLGLKGFPEWKDWLDRFTAFKKAMATSQIVEAALRFYAKHEGFEEPPQR